MKPCKWYKRLINFIVDLFIIEFITMIVLSTLILLGFNISTKIMVTDNTVIYIFSMLVFIIVAFIYYYIFEVFGGVTIGKLITKTKVLHKTNKSRYKTIAIRTCSRILLFEVIWFLRSRPKGLHDVLSKTIIVDK